MLLKLLHKINTDSKLEYKKIREFLCKHNHKHKQTNINNNFVIWTWTDKNSNQEKLQK